MTNANHQFDEHLRDQGISGGLEFLQQKFSDEKSYHQLFEVMKMRARFESGLPLLYTEDLQDVAAEKQRDFEERLVSSCRLVGKLFFESGDAQNGWLYFQPVGDSAEASRLLQCIPVDDENRDEIVHVALNEGVAPEYGFQLMLESMGTCNSITAFDGQINQMPKETRKGCAVLLVKHLYRELCENVAGHIEKQENECPGDSSLSGMTEGRPWLFEGGGHHVDTTHLASVVRIARYIDDVETVELAKQLASYGQQLDSQFHFDGDVPFESIYEDHLRYFESLAGGDPANVNAWFHRKLTELEPGFERNITVELFVDFLCRTQQFELATRVGLKEMAEDHQAMGIAPSLFEIAEMAGDYDLLISSFSQSGDVLGASIAKMLKHEQFEP